MTRISVIIPTYDRPSFLRQAVESVGEQTHSPIELIVVDDHSPTPVEDSVFETVADRNMETQIRRHETNRGAAAARNTGIEAASGEIIAFLDDDDRWTPEVAAVYSRTFDEAPDDVGLVSVGARNIDDSGDTVGRVSPQLYGDAQRSVAYGSRIGSFSRFAVSVDVVETAGGIDERLPVWQDLEWQCRLAAHCEFSVVPDLLVERTIGEHGQLTDAYDVRRNVAYPLIRDRHRPVFAKRGRWIERRFMGRLTMGLGSSALANHQHAEARKWFIRSIAFDPTQWETYVYLALAIGGPEVFSVTQRLRQTAARCVGVVRAHSLIDVRDH